MPRPLPRTSFGRTVYNQPSNSIPDESKSNVQHQTKGNTLTSQSGQQPQMPTRTNFVRTIGLCDRPSNNIPDESKSKVQHQAISDILTSHSGHTQMFAVKGAWSQNETEKKGVIDNSFEITSSLTNMENFMAMFAQLIPMYENAKLEFKLLVSTYGHKVKSEHKKEIEMLRSANTELRKATHEQSKFPNKVNEMDEIQKQNTQMEAMQQKLLNYEKLQTDNKNLQEELNIAKTDYEKQKMQCDTYDSHLKETNKRMEKMNELYTRSVKELEKELSETKTRLSKAIGDTLTTNNPNIADLSDQYRPTKLAEMHNELYDNEWTDAFEVAQNLFPEHGVPDRIKLLLDLLKEIKEFCEEEVELQENELVQTLYRTKKSKEVVLPDIIKRQLKELRRCIGPDMVVPLYQKFLQSGKRTVTKHKVFTSKVAGYVQKCMTLCWLMTISDPPVVFEHSVNVTSDSIKYKAFTQSGDTVEYVVWPKLLLSEGGQLLATGIAQFYHSARHRKPHSPATYNNFQDQPKITIRKTTTRNASLPPFNPDSCNQVEPSKESTQQSELLASDRSNAPSKLASKSQIKHSQCVQNADYSDPAQIQDSTTSDMKFKQMNNSTPYPKPGQVNYNVNNNAMNLNQQVPDYSIPNFTGESRYQYDKHINEHKRCEQYQRPDSEQKHRPVPFRPNADSYNLPPQNVQSNSNYVRHLPSR